ncbi:hypothetical protein F511_34299 [Dorcoceras hygrometricum]|uniref:Uncharacterized protein n=1 Tax=Dorcoceras hygrometricum TaxID=472368 RepID=A0A2Z7B7W3_9LAMI|nr:hypothetical protein F511_34299 [Dorcoceras hygrometricum]
MSVQAKLEADQITAKLKVEELRNISEELARRFTMIRWANSRTDNQLNVLSTRRGFQEVRLPKSQQESNRDLTMLRGKTVILQFRPPPPLLEHAAAAADRRRKIVSGQFDEENPFVLISSALLVQPDEGVSDLVVDRIGVNYRNLPRRAGFLKYRLEPGTSASKNRDEIGIEIPATPPPLAAAPFPTRRARMRARQPCALAAHGGWERRCTTRKRCAGSWPCWSTHIDRRCAATRAPAAREAAHSRAQLCSTIALRWPA